MKKKGFLYFALGAAAGAAALYYLKKNGGVHFSVDIEASDDADMDVDIDDELEVVEEENTACDCAEPGAESEV